MASRPAMTIEEIMRRKIASLRHWKHTKLYKNHSHWKFQFSVMTYNILSQVAIDNHRFLYRKCNPLWLFEEYRIAMVLPEILKSRSDIVCLQEVEEFVYEARMKHVLESNGFESIFKRRTCDKTDGCAILWRREMFQLVGQNDIEFRTRTSKVLDRDNIGLIAVLKPNHRDASNILLHVATTHLLYNPKRGDVKLCQLRWLLAELDRMALIEVKGDERRYHPVILCGDLNIEPNSPLYQFIETGRINVANAMSGDLSGQTESKQTGKRLHFENLQLNKIGISDASRFEKAPPKKRQMISTPLGGKPTSSTTMETTSSPTMVNGDEADQYSEFSKPINVSETFEPVQPSPDLNNKRLSSGFVDQNNTNIDTVIDNTSTTVNDAICSNDSESDEWFSHDFKFVPAYKFHNFNHDTLPVTSMVGNDCHTVDHIFYNVESKKDSHSYKEGTLKLLSVYSLLKKEDLIEIGGLPNAGLGSDHISLSALFGISLPAGKL